MDRKKAHALAKKAALETYNKTLKSIAQQLQQGEGGRVEQVETQYGGGKPYDPSQNTGGETLFGGENPVNRPWTFDEGWTSGRDRPHQESGRQRTPVPPIDKADPEYVKWYQEQAKDMDMGSGLEGDPLDFSMADDKDKKCPECGCPCSQKSDKKKEAATRLMRVAHQYKQALRGFKK